VSGKVGEAQAGGWDSYRGGFCKRGGGTGLQKSGNRSSKTQCKGKLPESQTENGGCPGGRGRAGGNFCRPYVQEERCQSGAAANAGLTDN